MMTGLGTEWQLLQNHLGWTELFLLSEFWLPIIVLHGRGALPAMGVFFLIINPIRIPRQN